MLELRLRLEGDGWTRLENLWVRGRPFYGRKALHPRELTVLLKRALIPGGDGDPEGVVDPVLLVALVRELRGFFAVIWKTGKEIVAFVDFVASFPLFYSVDDAAVVLTDRLYPVDGDASRLNILEYALTGYVTGDETIISKFRRIQAGEILLCGKNSREVRTVDYALFNPMNPPEMRGLHEVAELVEILDCRLRRAVERLIDYLDGRPAVIPLSGGWDSRTVIIHLKKMGYPRILSFSYGRQGNQEAEISQVVARQLDVPWVFVEYSNPKWSAFALKEVYRRYLLFAHNSVSVPHIQDLLAVYELASNGSLPRDAVIIPGHSGDFVAGSHMIVRYGHRRHIDGYIDGIMEKHYTLLGVEVLAEYFPRMFAREDLGEGIGGIRAKLANQIRNVVRKGQFAHPLALFDLWNWRERQSKFIVNSVRVYEFFGRDFWLPLWDLDFVSFWEVIPCELRLRRKLFGVYLENLQKSIGLSVPVAPTRQWLASRVSGIVPDTLKHRIARQVRRIGFARDYERHPMQWYGVWDASRFQRLARLAKGSENVNSLVVLDTIGEFYA